MAEQKQKAVATELRPGDLIIVNMAAVKGGAKGARAAVNGVFNHKGQAVDGTGTPIYGVAGLNVEGLAATAGAPTFPLAEFQAAVAAGDLAKADTLRLAHAAKQEAYEKNGGGTLTDSIGNAVIEWAKANFGITTDAGGRDDVLTINPAEVFV